MLDEFCPDCGTHRVALFRYCLKCGLDFDDLDARGELPGGPYSPPRGMAVKDRVPAAGAGHAARAVGRTRRRTASYLPAGIAAVLAVAVVGALAIGAGNGIIGTAVRTSAAPTPSVAAVAVPAALVPTPTPTAEPVLAPTGETTQATVKRVVDGDTIIVFVADTEYRVRYIGVDAPESVSLERPVEFMGRDAADANRRLVSSASVVLERDQSETDAYGQLLRHVWVERDGALVLVGLEIVRAGLARIEPSAQDTKYAALLEDAEQAARAAGIGIWSAPPLPITGPTPAPIEAFLPRLVRADPIIIYSSAPTQLTGAAGVYTWRSVGFADANVQLTWDVKASATRSCAFVWRLEPAVGAGVGSSIDVSVRGRETGGRTVAIDFTDALLVTTTTCPDWSLSMQGTDTP